MMELSRKKFLTMFGALGVASAVPQAMGKGEGIEKYLTTGPNPEKRHYPIVNGWDNRPHYPVMENTFGEMGWEKKSPGEIVADITRGVAKMQEISKGMLKPDMDFFAIAIPPSRAQFWEKKFQHLGTDVWYFVRNCWPKAIIFHESHHTRKLEDSGFLKSAEISIGYCPPNSCEPIFFTQYGI